VKGEFPQWAELIDWAFAMRVGQVEANPDTDATYARVEAFVQFIIVEIKGTGIYR